MKIVVINGTEVKGCTYHIREAFLEGLRKINEIQEFYLPKDLPHFCCGCKTCFFKSEKNALTPNMFYRYGTRFYLQSCLYSLLPYMR